MRSHIFFRGSALAFLLVLAAQASAGPTIPPGEHWITAGKVRALLMEKGYSRITEMDIDNGVWEVEATDPQGRRAEVLLDPRDGRILSDTTPVILGTVDIHKKLAAAGYTRVHDLEFDHGVWQADAVGPKGDRVEVTLDARTGDVLHVENDWLD